jgi:hypothetical protein
VVVSVEVCVLFLWVENWCQQNDFESCGAQLDMQLRKSGEFWDCVHLWSSYCSGGMATLHVMICQERWLWHAMFSVTESLRTTVHTSVVVVGNASSTMVLAGVQWWCWHPKLVLSLYDACWALACWWTILESGYVPCFGIILWTLWKMVLCRTKVGGGAFWASFNGGTPLTVPWCLVHCTALW